MRLRTRGLIWMNLYPLSHQLGIWIEVEVEVDLKEQVTIGREICRRMNLQIMISRKLHMYQRFRRVQRRYLRSYCRCSLCISRACQTQR